MTTGVYADQGFVKGEGMFATTRSIVPFAESEARTLNHVNAVKASIFNCIGHAVSLPYEKAFRTTRGANTFLDVATPEQRRALQAFTASPSRLADLQTIFPGADIARLNSLHVSERIKELVRESLAEVGDPGKLGRIVPGGISWRLREDRGEV
jgi:hypothetical protein